MNSSRSIALIDDDRAWLETLSDFLQSRGHSVVTAEGGLRGLDLLAQREVSLAIVDFHMPDLDGLELIRLLRQRGQRARVLMLSSEEDPELAVRALALGATAFLSKSEKPAVFLKALQQALTSLLILAPHTGSLLQLAYRPNRWLPVPFGQRPFSRN
jgi:CheY-like chemotaxis protein